MNRASSRQGFFLVIVLIVVAVGTLAVYSFTELMIAYDDAAFLQGDLVQARVTAESGAEAVRITLAQPPIARTDVGGVYNNPQLFQAIPVSGGTDGSPLSNFSIIAPALDEMGSLGGIRFGLEDESARLNPNILPLLENNSAAMLAAATFLVSSEEDSGEDSLDTENLAVSLLMGLPGMTEDTAEAILDWIDEDDEDRDFGAESEYYESLPTPYSCANGPILSVDDLLLVRGVTPTLLFGADVNRNGVIDADEQQRFGVGVDTSGAFGWSSFLTVHGAEANKTQDGNPRVNVNQDDLELLYEELAETNLGEIYTSFIVAYRIAGQSSSLLSAAGAAGNNTDNSNAQPGGVWTPDLLESFDLSGGGDVSLTQILDLVDATVTVGNGDNARSFTSPFAGDPVSMAVYMADLMDSVTTQDAAVMPGRINLNECPAELLYGIPLLSEEAIEAILQERDPTSDDPGRQFETWPLAEGLITIDEMRALTPLLCGGGDVYRGQIIGYFEGNGISQRFEVIVDATTVNPKIVSWRDLSHLGRGFDLSVLGIRATTIE